MASLGSQTVGSVVKLNVNGTAKEFIVVHHGLPSDLYDSSCDGTWLLMKDIYEERIWGSSTNNYADSDIHSYLNNTFVNLFDSDITSVIKQAKLPYTNGTGDGSLATGSSGISAKVFLLSYTEVGFSGSSFANVEGAVLDHFDGAADSDRIGYLNGSATSWWLRTPRTNLVNYVMLVNTSGKNSSSGGTGTRGVRPALVLPGDLTVSDDGSVCVESGAITGSVNINGVQRELTGEGYVNIGGVLRELSDSQVDIGVTLNSLKG